MSYDEAKFQEFNKLLKSDADIVVISHPEVLGDNYEEICENLRRLGDSGKPLHIVPSKPAIPPMDSFMAS